jgi:hypothetical protein
MGIMDVIRGFTQPAVQPTPVNNIGLTGNVGGQTPDNVNPNSVNNTTATVPDPGNPTNPANSTGSPDGSVGAFGKVDDGKSPLDSYKDLWQPAKDTKAGSPPSLVPTFTMDMTKIQTAAGQLDFTKGLDTETISMALKGDAQALAKALNTTAQSGFAHAVAATGTIVKEALQQQSDTFFKTVVPDMFRRERIAQGVQEANPAFADPALAPLVQATERQMAQKYPQASAAEITQYTRDFLSNAASAIAKGNKQQITDIPTLDNTSVYGNMGGTTDWDNWIKV